MPGLLAIVILMNRVISFYRVPAWRDDIALLSRAVEDFPSNTYCSTTFARHLMRSYYYRDAIAHLQIAVQQDPADVGSRLLLAEALLGVDEFAAATQLLQSMQQQANPQQGNGIAYFLYVAQRNSGNGPLARQQLLKLLERLAP